MNSKERHELRYQGRKQRRLAKKSELADTYCDYDKVFSFDNLYESYKKCCKGVGWKASTQLYRSNALLNVNKTYKALRLGTYRTHGFHEFDIVERGKPRHIQSVSLDERIVQRCLCDYCLVPILRRSFVYDNAACLKRKGVDFALDRMNTHLEKYYRQHGSKGYALVFDFSQYFKNICHDKVKEIVSKHIQDERLLRLIYKLIDDFGEDGLGLGSQISQILALSLPNRLDHYIKEDLCIRHYIRYMDDGCIIHPNKEYLRFCLSEIKRICGELGIILNERKTQIISLSRGIRFLKVRFILTRTGKVIRKPNKKNIVKMRYKLKAFKRRVDNGTMSMGTVRTSLMSWRSRQLKCNSYWARQRVYKLFIGLFYRTEKISIASVIDARR